MTPPEAAEEPEPPDIDENGVDRAQIRAMLALTLEERLARMQAFRDAVLEIRRIDASKPDR